MFSISARARTRIVPRPVSYASRSDPSSTTIPPVGKSGPSTKRIRSSTVGFGRLFVSTCSIAEAISERLWGGIFVAIPTAIPEAPLTNRFGIAAGKQIGSSLSPSKFGEKSTVSSSSPVTIAIAAGVKRASVYRYAAGGSSRLPKLPLGSTRGTDIEKGCPILTIAS